MLKKKQAQKLVVLLVSVPLFGNHKCTYACASLFFMKVEWKQVCEQSLYVETTSHCYVNTKNNSKVDYFYNGNLLLFTSSIKATRCSMGILTSKKSGCLLSDQLATYATYNSG